MVRRALSHRRGSNLKLEVDTASTAASTTPTFVSIPVVVRTGTARRESLPLSRHHLLRRSSTASTSSFGGSSSSSSRGADLYDGGSVIVDDIDEELEGEAKEGGN